MAEWLLTQAQSASPFVAVFCLGVCWLLWRHILFINSEHRKAETTFATSMLEMAKSVQKLADAVGRAPPRQRAQK